MSEEWEVKKWDTDMSVVRAVIPTGYKTVCLCETGLAQQIAQEHNAHISLLNVLRAAEKAVGIINRRSDNWDYAEVLYADVEALRAAIEQARQLQG